MAAARRCGDGSKTVLIAPPFVDRARRLKHTLLRSAGSANACVHPLAPSERQLDSIGFDSDPSHEVLLADGTASLSDALLAFAEVPNGYLSISGLPKRLQKAIECTHRGKNVEERVKMLTESKSFSRD